MTTPIEAIGAVQGALAAPTATAAPSVSNEAATQRFASLMRPADAPLRPSPAADDGPNAITQAVSTQEEQVRRTFDDSRHFARNMHNYDMVDVLIEGDKFKNKLAIATLSLSAVQGVAQSTNKGLTTLLKNQ
jgi:hypothetical protein